MAEKTLPPIIMEVENSPFGDKFYTSSVWPQKFHVRVVREISLKFPQKPTWKAKCPIFKAIVAGFRGFQLPQKIGHLAFQVGWWIFSDLARQLVSLVPTGFTCLALVPQRPKEPTSLLTAGVLFVVQAAKRGNSAKAKDGGNLWTL